MEKINKIYKLNKTILREDKFIIDRSLNAKKFNKNYKININSWNKQILNMHKDFLKNKKIYSYDI